MDFLVNDVMLPLLKFLCTITPNYGLAIILLTLLVKLVFQPLSHKQFVSMKEMQVIQPVMKEIQDKYKGEPQKMQEKLMALYKDHNINPLAGCLPLLVQLPFLIALFMTLNSPEFKVLITQAGVNANFLWIKDLGSKDPLFILPCLIGILTYWSQKLTMGKQSNIDGTQKMMLQYMPIMLVVLSWSMPSGVLLYWTVSQGVGTLQQMLALSQPLSAKMQILHDEHNRKASKK